jgi:flotillin
MLEDWPVLTGLLVLLVVFLLAGMVVLAKSYKRCPQGKLLVVYGAGPPSTFAVVDSGGRFVIPLIQDYAYLSLIPLNVPLPEQANRQIQVKIGDSLELRRNAAIGLLGLSDEEIVARVQELLAPTKPEDKGRSFTEALATVGLEII